MCFVQLPKFTFAYKNSNNLDCIHTVDIYNERITLYVDTSDGIQRVMQVHEPLCKSGNVEDHNTLETMPKGASLQTDRHFAIQAAMAQRLSIMDLDNIY